MELTTIVYVIVFCFALELLCYYIFDSEDIKNRHSKNSSKIVYDIDREKYDADQRRQYYQNKS